MNLECPKCGNKVNPNAKRPQCGKCRYSFPRKNSAKSQPTQPKVSQISDDIMQGSILNALEKADIDPTNHREMFKDAIPLIIKEDKLKFAFAQACQDRKRSPEVIVRKAIKFWLKENKYLK